MKKLLFALCGVVVLCLIVASIQRKKLMAQLELPRSSDIRIVKDKTPVAPAPEVAPALPTKPKVPEAIQKAFETAESDLRRQEEVRAEVQADPHATPPSILLGGQRLGEVFELENKNPGLKEEFLNFYLSCAQDQEAITVNRVQCLQRYLDKKGLAGHEAQAVVDSMPDSVKRIYRRLRDAG